MSVKWHVDIGIVRKQMVIKRKLLVSTLLLLHGQLLDLPPSKMQLMSISLVYIRGDNGNLQ